jgi:hypothetical protein
LALGASVAWGGSDFVAGVATRRRSLLLVLCGSQACGLLVVLAVLAAGDLPHAWAAGGIALALAGVALVTPRWFQAGAPTGAVWRRKASTSRLTSAAWVTHMTCGPPSIST